MQWHGKAAGPLSCSLSQGVTMPYIHILKAHTQEASGIPPSLSLLPSTQSIPSCLTLKYLANPESSLHFLLYQSFPQLPLFPLHHNSLQTGVPTLLIICNLRNLLKCKSGCVFLLSHLPIPYNLKIFQWLPVAFTILPQILNSTYMAFQAVSPPHVRVPASSGNLSPLFPDSTCTNLISVFLVLC